MATDHAHCTDTEKYYAETMKANRDVWGGTNDRMCWGYFDSFHSDIQLAGERHAERMAAISGFTAESKVLDVGCGKGASVFYLHETFGCEITALDLTAKLIEVCNEKKARLGYDKINFLVGTLHDLDAQLPDNHYTHVWSNAVFNHIPEQARKETMHILYRKLAPGGRIDFDDCCCRQQEDSDLVRINVKERLHFDGIWTFKDYVDSLEDAGFKLITSEDITCHMEQTYRTTSANAKKHNYDELSKMHHETANACSRGAFGWGIYRAVKPKE